MMLTIAICDNNAQDLVEMHDYLQVLKAEKYPITCKLFKDALALGVAYRQGKRFDLIILDMMHRGRNSLETAQLIRSLDSKVPIIAVSGTAAAAIECIDLKVRAYLLKPLNKQKFLVAIRKTLKSLREQEPGYYGFHNAQGWHKINLKDILYFESNLRKIRLRTLVAEYSFTASIHNIERQLEQKHFVRVHKSFVVNLVHLLKFAGDSLTLVNKEVIPLSKHKKRKLRLRFLAFLNQYLSPKKM
jgi:two-component system LytT family response regulator